MPGGPPLAMRDLEYIQGLLLEVGVPCDGIFPLRRQTHQMATVVPKYQACTKANTPARTYWPYMTTMYEARYSTMNFYTTYIFMFHFMINSLPSSPLAWLVILVSSTVFASILQSFTVVCSRLQSFAVVCSPSRYFAVWS